MEDLYDVLKEALELHPDIKGVSSGAIASTYQKLRVEDWYTRSLSKLFAPWPVESSLFMEPGSISTSAADD